MNKKDLSCSVEVFIEKYHPTTGKVKLPDFDFKIKRIDKVKIDEGSLKKFGETVTFTGTAKITYIDITNVSMTEDFTLTGNTTYVENKNDQPIQSVVITQIKRKNEW